MAGKQREIGLGRFDKGGQFFNGRKPLSGAISEFKFPALGI